MFIVNVEGAIFKGDKWLFIERSTKESHAGGMIALVGGKVDLEGDSVDILERTIKREVFEEVGIEINESMHYVQSTSFVTDKGEGSEGISIKDISGGQYAICRIELDNENKDSFERAINEMDRGFEYI